MSTSVLEPAAASQALAPKPAAGGWLYHPALDLMIGCGAWSAPLLLAAWWLGADHGVQMSIALYALTLLANNPHYFATIYRAYRRPEDRRKYRIFTVHLTIVLGLVALFAHRSTWALPWLYTVYLTWSPWHYTGQNFGLLMMFGRRNAAAVEKRERNALHAAFLASYLMLFVNFHTGASNDPYLLSLGLPAGPGKLANGLLLAVFVGASAFAMRRLIGRAGWRAMAAPLVLLATQSLWFVVPAVVQTFFGGAVPQARYSTGVLALMHSAQYLWITSYYARREAEAGGAQRWRPLVYFAVLIVGGITLFVPAPWLMSRVLHQDFTTSFLIFASLVNLHHFMLDGAIWKLRDSRIAGLLIEAGSRLAGKSASEAGRGRLAWFAGPTKPARALRVAAAVSLIGIAGLDQARNYFSADPEAPANLARAESLNPYDAALHLRRARAASRAGDLEGRLAALERALAVDPQNREARETLARALIENRMFERAYAHYQRISAQVPLDSSAWFNMGTLAAQLKRDDEAIKHWEKAVEMDVANREARLSLAEAYDRRGEAARAILHYEKYLVQLTAAAAAEKPTPDGVLYVALKLAENYTLSRQPERAVKYYEQLAAIAEQAGELRYASLSYARRAYLYAGMGQAANAVFCHQAAIRLNRSAGETRAAGADWFAFGQYLAKQPATRRLALACMLKAEALLKAAGSEDLVTVSREREALENDLGAEAAKVRRELEAAAEEALRFRP